MKTVMLVGAALVFAACSATEAAPEDESERPVVVSSETTCGDLFSGKPRLWSETVAAVAAGEATSDLGIRLTEIAEASGTELQPRVEVMASTVTAGTHDAAAFKTAARKVADICAPYVA